jgi:serine/threonine protein kinase
MHKDIKPLNLLVSRGTSDGNVTKVSVKYADFGISNLVYEGKLLKTSTIVTGTKKYAGSEMKG